MTAKVRWLEIFNEMVDDHEKRLGTYLIIDQAILCEVAHKADEGVALFNQSTPNIAKIAGSVSFWIRKLKPISVHPSAENNLTCINERIGLLVGLALCRRYSREQWITHPNARIFDDWVTSLRFHSHSISSTVLAFELLTNPNPKRCA